MYQRRFIIAERQAEKALIGILASAPGVCLFIVFDYITV